MEVIRFGIYSNRRLLLQSNTLRLKLIGMLPSYDKLLSVLPIPGSSLFIYYQTNRLKLWMLRKVILPGQESAGNIIVINKTHLITTQVILSFPRPPPSHKQPFVKQQTKTRQFIPGFQLNLSRVIQ